MKECRETGKIACSVMRLINTLQSCIWRTGSPAVLLSSVPWTSGIAHSQFSRRTMTIYGRRRGIDDSMRALGTTASRREESLQRFAAHQQGCGKRAWLHLDLGRVIAASPAVRVQSIFVMGPMCDGRRGIQHQAFARL